MPSRLLTIHLSSTAAIAVAGDSGVDLGEVGRALGLDPATVRLNGYFLSRGPDHISAVTWRALLAFSAARALPTGAAAAAPIAVHGKPSPWASEARNLLCWKRKSGLEDGNSLKKSKLTESSSAVSEPGDGQLTDDITLGMKRRLRLEDTNPVKKLKQIEYNSGSVNGALTPPSVKFSCSFINGHEKRPREEEMGTSLSCKRVR